MCLNARMRACRKKLLYDNQEQCVRIPMRKGRAMPEPFKLGGGGRVRGFAAVGLSELEDRGQLRDYEWK